jgi:hypothetical protein
MLKKPLQGHKFERIRYTAQAVCECGWESSSWCGKGARAQAYAEFHSHIERCERAAA